MSRRNRKKRRNPVPQPTGTGLLAMLALGGVAYLLYRRAHGLGSGDYGIIKRIEPVRPKPWVWKSAVGAAQSYGVPQPIKLTPNVFPHVLPLLPSPTMPGGGPAGVMVDVPDVPGGPAAKVVDLDFHKTPTVSPPKYDTLWTPMLGPIPTPGLSLQQQQSLDPVAFAQQEEAYIVDLPYPHQPTQGTTRGSDSNTYDFRKKASGAALRSGPETPLPVPTLPEPVDPREIARQQRVAKAKAEKLSSMESRMSQMEKRLAAGLPVIETKPQVVEEKWYEAQSIPRPSIDIMPMSPASAFYRTVASGAESYIKEKVAPYTSIINMSEQDTNQLVRSLSRDVESLLDAKTPEDQIQPEIEKRAAARIGRYVTDRISAEAAGLLMVPGKIEDYAKEQLLKVKPHAEAAVKALASAGSEVVKEVEAKGVKYAEGYAGIEIMKRLRSDPKSKDLPQEILERLADVGVKTWRENYGKPQEDIEHLIEKSMAAKGKSKELYPEIAYNRTRTDLTKRNLPLSPDDIEVVAKLARELAEKNTPEEQMKLRVGAATIDQILYGQVKDKEFMGVKLTGEDVKAALKASDEFLGRSMAVSSPSWWTEWGGQIQAPTDFWQELKSAARDVASFRPVPIGFERAAQRTVARVKVATIAKAATQKVLKEYLPFMSDKEAGEVGNVVVRAVRDNMQLPTDYSAGIDAFLSPVAQQSIVNGVLNTVRVAILKHASAGDLTVDGVLALSKKLKGVAPDDPRLKDTILLIERLNETKDAKTQSNMNTVISSYLGGKPIEVPISMVRKLLPREVPGVQVDLPEHAAQKEPLTLYKVSERQYVKDELDRLYEQLVERSTGKYVVKDGKMVFKRGSDGVYHSERMQELWEEEAARLREKFGALVAEKAAKAGPGVPVLRRPGEYVPGAALLQTVPKTKRAMEKLDLALIPLDEDNPERSIEPLLYKGDVTGSTFNKAVKPKLQILLSLKDDLPKGTMTTAAVNMVKSFAMSNLPGFLPVYSSVTRQFAPADGKFHMEYEANLPSQREAKENLIYGIRTWNAFVQDLKNNVAPTIAFGNLQSRLQVAANEIHRKREEQNLRFANEAKKERYAEESGTMEGLEGVAAMEFGPRRHRRSGWMT